MKRPFSMSRQSGFTILELVTALGIFLIVCGAAFALLATSQTRFQADSQLLNSFQEARLGMDQMVRDINDAGFPPPSYFASPNIQPTQFADRPFAWSPNPTGPGCGMTTCVSPSAFDLIIETNTDPANLTFVSWIRYQLGGPNGTTLMRGITQVKPGTDPTTDPDLASSMTPYVQNVVNNASSSQIAQFQAAYPSMFSSSDPVPIFSYVCHPASTPSLQACGSGDTPKNITDVSVTLIVMSSTADPQSGIPRLVQLTGRGRRVNPTQ